MSGIVLIMDSNKDTDSAKLNVPLQDITKQAFLRQDFVPLKETDAPELNADYVKNMHSTLYNFYAPFFETNRKRLCITNHQDNKPEKTFYYVTITKQSISFELKSSVKKDTIVYDFDQKTIALNGQKKSDHFLKKFIEKIEKMSKDIRENKAEVFEEFETLPNTSEATPKK